MYNTFDKMIKNLHLKIKKYQKLFTQIVFIQTIFKA